MFSPLAFPEGAIYYDLTTHAPLPSHLVLTPFDLYREPFAIIAIADGAEMSHEAFSRRMSPNGAPINVVERNIKALYQELEDLRDNYSRAIVHQVLIFDYVAPEVSSLPMAEVIMSIPPLVQHKRTTMKSVMCDISSIVLAEMTTLAKSFEVMNFVDSPGHLAATSAPSWSSDASSVPNRWSTHHSLSASSRSASASGLGDRKAVRMSMPVFKQEHGTTESGSSTPMQRPTTPVGSQLAQPPRTFDDIADRSPLDGQNPKRAFPGSRRETLEGFRSSSQDRFSVQGFGPGGPNDRFRVKGKGRVSIILGSLYLQAGLWSICLTHLIEGATVARSVNDHVWHGKALELILVALILLGHSHLEFLIPAVLLPPQEKGEKKVTIPEANITDPSQPKWLRSLQLVLPDLVERIIGLYSRTSVEKLPPLALSEAIIRLSRMLAAIHITDGLLNEESLKIMVIGAAPEGELTTSPRIIVTPTRQQITNLLFRAFPGHAGELLSTVDRSVILSGIASVFGSIGFQRKKAMMIRELVSVLTGGLVEARTRGAAEVGIHPAASLVALKSVNSHSNGAGALELGEGDVEYGLDAFLGILCRIYGIVGPYTNWKDPNADMPSLDDSDDAVVSRIQKQSASRFYGINSLKLDILRACINFSEALPDFNGVLRFSSDLLRTAGRGIAPSSRREDASAIIPRDEQVRLVTNISKTSNLSRRLGLSNLVAAEYWDEFLLRGVTLEPLPASRAPVAHSRAQLQSASNERASQDVNPFIYNPFLKDASSTSESKTLLVAGETASFKLTLQNPYDLDIEVESIRLDTEGVEFESVAESAIVGPYRTQLLKARGVAKGAGSLKVIGAIIQVRGCRERRFPIFSRPWAPRKEERVKALGIEILDRNIMDIKAANGPKPTTVDLSVIAPQPVVGIKCTSLPQASVMVLEGERQLFSVTLENFSRTTAVDFLFFSFHDSTQGPLQAALKNRDATPAELYEYELILAKKQALRLRKPQSRYIAPGCCATFEIEILGKPGLTSGTIQVDYAFLGVPQDEVGDVFHTRQVCLDLHVTVNASIEVGRVDMLPLNGTIPRPLWTSTSGLAKNEGVITEEDYCLLLMDLRNAWPSHMGVHLDIGDGLAIDEQILPGNTSRVIVPVKRIYLKDPHASIPTLNPSRQRQFVVSTSKITPDMERTSREAFWYRERVLESLKGTWKTLLGPARSGEVELRAIRLTGRMMEAVKVDPVSIDISVTSLDGANGEAHFKPGTISKIFVDEFVQIKARIANRSSSPIYPTLRIMPVLCHRPLNVGLDFTRKWAWNGTLQQHLPLLGAGKTTEVLVGGTALCRGEFEITASVEETMLYRSANDDESEKAKSLGSDTQSMIDAVIGPRERRFWSSRIPARVFVRDRQREYGG